MRRLSMVAALFCFVFSGSLAASGAEKVDKKTYQQQAEKTLKGFEQKMDEMKAKAAGMKMESKEKFDREMEVLKEKKAVADRKLEKLGSATAENWGKMKDEMDNAMDDLKKQYDGMKSRFRKE